MNNTLVRIITAAVVIPPLLYIFYKGGHLFLGLIEVVIFIGMNEYHNMVEQKALSPDRTLGTVLAMALGLVAYTGNAELLMAAFVISVLLILANRLRTLDIEHAITGIGATLFGVVYIGLLLSHANLLRVARNPVNGNDLGFFFMIMAIAATFLADAGAYFTGRAHGKTKLAPFISPGKTREGALGGIAGGALGVVLTKLVFDWFIFDAPTGMPLIHCVVLGPLLVVATIAGDLSESLMKRDSGIKDSGNIIPGHGGIMDRLDSILFALPVTYYYLKLFVYGGIL